MKVICPECKEIGSMQQRGNSVRVGHYVGYRGDTRLIQWHCTTIEALQLVNNGNFNMVNNGLPTHNLECIRGKCPVPKGRVLESRPRHQYFGYLSSEFLIGELNGD